MKVYIYGNPPTAQNAYYIEKIRGQAPLCSWTGRTSITQEDLTQFGITSDNGLYHWQIESWHGALGPRGPSPSRRLFAPDEVLPQSACAWPARIPYEISHTTPSSRTPLA